LTTWDRSFPIDTSAALWETLAGAVDRLNADPGAIWNDATNAIEGSCAPDCAPISPRLVALALFDVDVFQYMRATDSWCPGNQPCIKAVNFIGFFIESPTAAGVTGRVARYPGLSSEDYPSVAPESSFLPAITLVR
jgi:hypothetical protein